MKRGIASALLLAALPGCALIEHAQPAPELYVLKPHVQSEAENPLPVSLRIMPPQVSPGLDTARIAVLDAPNHLTYYNGVSWAQPLPLVAQDFLIDAFEQARAFKSVASDRDGAFTDYTLMIELNDCEVDKTSSEPSVKLRLTAKLARNADNRIVAAFPIEKTAPAQGPGMAAVIAAFNGALQDAADELLRDLLTVAIPSPFRGEG